MAEALSRRPLTVESRVQSPFSPWQFTRGLGGARTGISQSTSVFSVSVFPPVLHTALRLTGVLRAGKASELSNKELVV